MLDFIIEIATLFFAAFAIGSICYLSYEFLYKKLLEIASKAKNIGYIIAFAKIKRILSSGKYKTVNIGLLDDSNNEIYTDSIKVQNIDRNIKSGMLIRI